MLIKICGITNLEEIKALNELKPDYIGFIFTKSKRQVDINKAKTLFDSLDKDIKAVGVFRNNEMEFILEVLKEIPLYAVQLHGDEDIAFINELKKHTNCNIWKAYGVETKEDIITAMNYPVDTLILDGSNPGSGKIFPWECLDGIKFNKTVILAGGINEDNVIEGIEKVKPDGIDVSSGVEIIDKNGVRTKSREKIERLIKKVRYYDERKI